MEQKLKGFCYSVKPNRRWRIILIPHLQNVIAAFLLPFVFPLLFVTHCGLIWFPVTQSVGFFLLIYERVIVLWYSKVCLVSRCIETKVVP